MQYNIVFNVVYDIVCFRPSLLEALKIACGALRVSLMLNFAFLIAFYWLAQKLHDLISTLCRCTCRSYVCSTATHPPSDHQFISFQGQCCTQTLELICTPGPTVPLRGHATAVCVELEVLQVLKLPPPAPCMAEKKEPVAPSEAIRYPLQGPAHFMGPLAFCMASCHGHFFRIGTAEKPNFPPFLAWC
jgi:hypothetical protein